MAIYLIDQNDTRYDLKDVTIFGRSKGDFKFPNDDHFSSRHFKIVRLEELYYLIDLGSKNKTRLNNAVVIPDTKNQINNGDNIVAGGVIFNVCGKSAGTSTLNLAKTLKQKPYKSRSNNNTFSGTSKHVRSIGLDILFWILSFGLYGIYLQHKQNQAVNEILKTKKYGIFKWMFLVAITFGLYHIYHNYQMSCDIAIAQKKDHFSFSLIIIILTIFTFSLVADAVIQKEINRYFS